MVRVVLTVALAVAVLSVSLPAVEQAGVQRGDAATRSAVDRLVAEGRALAADSEALPPELAGARRVLELDLPEPGPARAGLAELRVEPLSEGGDGLGTRVSWRVHGGTRHVVQVDSLAVRPADPDARAVVFERGGTRRVVLELVRVDGRRVVRVRRGFK